MLISSTIQVVRTAEIVFCSRPTDGWKFIITIDVKFDFTFSPPTGVVHAPSRIGADILSPPLHTRMV